VENNDQLDALAGEARAAIARLSARMAAGELTVDEWKAEMLKVLAIYLAAAMLLGLASDTLSAAQEKRVASALREQANYLNGFGDAVEANGWNESSGVRAGMYADSVTPVFWQGRTWGLPLPSLPGEGTQCLNHCRCEWQIVPLDAENGDYDAYWKLNEDAEHCQTCAQRAHDWQPVQIRRGILL